MKNLKIKSKPLIICIIGESCTGKTLISKYIEDEFSIKMIESYTDRPKREPNEVGHTFVSTEEFDNLKIGDMIAYTDFGSKRYCCLKKDVRDINTYIIDEDGYKMLKNRYNDLYDIKSIRLICNEGIRIQRGGKDRVDRDKNRFTLPLVVFDAVIVTNQPKEDTFKEVKSCISRIITDSEFDILV